MTDKIDDYDAWKLYPNHHLWFNKLCLAERLGYKCGPAGIPTPKLDEYIIRPIYNLRGMALGAYVDEIHPLKQDTIPPGYFWCEKFEGVHRTIDYKFSPQKPPFWKKLYSFIGHKESLTRFSRWEKDDFDLNLPQFFTDLADVGHINIETIGDKIIEVHLRPNPDPVEYDEFIPVWNDKNLIEGKISEGYRWVKATDDADGQLELPRSGFLVR